MTWPRQGTIWRMLAQRGRSEPLPTGLDAMWHAAAGQCRQWATQARHFLAQARKIDAMSDQFAHLSDSALRTCCSDLRDIFRRGRETPADILRAGAVVRAVAARTVGLTPFPVQLAGAMALEAGCVVEMATGEGKTLTATIPAALAGWRGRGCHVVTANDYLAGRDAELMAPVYEFCGLRVKAIDPEMPPPARREAYQADITYTTNKEAAADFLRDRLAMGRLTSVSQMLLREISGQDVGGVRQLVQRGLDCAIVDEADSVLIDEAVTPLIISGQAPNPQQVEAFTQAAALAGEMTPTKHYKVNERYHEVELTAAGKAYLAERAHVMGGLWQGARRREELVTQALTARELYRAGKQYVIQDEKVVIVDEFTGRLMPDREWRDGLHQAVSAKEGLEIEPPKDTYARISFQRFFRMYRKLAGMTGTAAEARREFWQVYRLPIVILPTHRPCIRRIEPDAIFTTAQDKWQAIVAEIQAVHAAGRPVLVGTRSVHASEHLSSLLTEAGLDHQVLNAVHHEAEAQVVAQAGQPGRITVATNMAGRGTDIKLGRGVADNGGLHVIATERHESGRIDRQLFGRCARLGDPGSVRAFASLEDELVTRHASQVGAELIRRAGASTSAPPMARRLLMSAQRRAQRQALRQRKGVLKTDTWLDETLGFAGREV
jgi:preprotein translocase subunit SecA